MPGRARTGVGLQCHWGPGRAASPAGLAPWRVPGGRRRSERRSGRRSAAVRAPRASRRRRPPGAGQVTGARCSMLARSPRRRVAIDFIHPRRTVSIGGPAGIVGSAGSRCGGLITWRAPLHVCLLLQGWRPAETTRADSEPIQSAPCPGYGPLSGRHES